jgi:hypothetical protein
MSKLKVFVTNIMEFVKLFFGSVLLLKKMKMETTLLQFYS